MAPHEAHYPRRPDLDDDGNWGMVPFLLGVVAIMLVGVLALTASTLPPLPH